MEWTTMQEAKVPRECAECGGAGCSSEAGLGLYSKKAVPVAHMGPVKTAADYR